MAVTILSICNMALSRIAQKAVEDLEDNLLPEVSSCNMFYDSVRQWLLRKYPWGFAKATAELVVTENSPLGWTYEYDKPAGALRIWSVTDETGGVSGELVRTFVNGEMVYLPAAGNTIKIPFIIRGDKILTNLEDAYVIYSADEEDPALFDPSFVEAFTWRLAYEIAMPITGKFALRREALAGYNDSAIVASASDAMEHSSPAVFQSSLLAAYRGGGQ